MPRPTNLIPFAGADYGAPAPEPAPAPPPDPQMLELRNAKLEAQTLANRVKQLEGALRAAAHVLAPYSRPSRTEK
jgi:hypothetical protein